MYKQNWETILSLSWVPYINYKTKKDYTCIKQSWLLMRGKYVTLNKSFMKGFALKNSFQVNYIYYLSTCALTVNLSAAGG